MPEFPQMQPVTDAQRQKVLAYPPLDSLVPAHWTQGDVTASDGTRLHFTRSGGPDGKAPLLLLHGFTDNGLCWLRVAQALEADYDLVMPDARGHGCSGLAEGSFSLARMAQDAAELIEALGLGRPAVLGHSMGAEVAVRLAVEYPALARAILLEDPPFHAAGRPDTPEYHAWAQQWLAWLVALKTQGQDERRLSCLERNPPMADWDILEFLTWVDAQAQFNPDVLPQAGDFDFVTGKPDGAASVTCPLLLLAGNPARGGMVSQQDEAALTAAWGDGRFVRFDGAGHLVHRDQFAQFMDVVTAYLTEVYAT